MSTIIRTYAQSTRRGKYSINLDYNITYSSGVATITVNYIWLECLSAGSDLPNSRIGRAATKSGNPNYITINNVKKQWYFGKISCGANGAAVDDVNGLTPQIKCYGGKTVSTGVAPSSPGTSLGLSWNITLLNNNTLITSVPLKLEWVTSLGGSTAVFDKDNSWALDSSTIGIEAQIEFAGASILTLNDVTEYQFGTTLSTYPTVTINKTISDNTDKLQYRIGKSGSWTNVTSSTTDSGSVSLQSLLRNTTFQSAAYAAMGATQASISLGIRSVTNGTSVPAQGQATNIVEVTLKAENKLPTCSLSSSAAFKYKILGTSTYQTISSSGTTVFTHPNNIYSLNLNLQAFNGAYVDSITLFVDGAQLEKSQNFNSSTVTYQSTKFDGVNSYNLTGKQITYKITDTRKRSASGTLVTISQLSPYVSPSAEITLNKSFLDLDILTGTVKFKVNFNQPINAVSALDSIKIYDSNITDLSNITSTTTPVYSAAISNSQLNCAIYTSKYSSNSSTTATAQDYRIDSDNHRLVGYTTGATIDARIIYYQSSATTTTAPSRNTYSSSITFAIPQTTNGTTFKIIVTDIFGNSASADLTVFAEPVFDWGANDFQFNVPAILNKGGTLKPYRFVNIDDYCYTSTLHNDEKLNYFLSIAMYACPEGLSVLYTNGGSVQLPNSENAGNAGYTTSSSTGKNAWNSCEVVVLRRRSGMSDIVNEYSLDTTVLLFHNNKIAYNYATAITPSTMPDKAKAKTSSTNGWQGWKVLDLGNLARNVTYGTATPTGTATEGDIYFKYTN